MTMRVPGFSPLLDLIVIAIIFDQHGRIVLQLRDDNPAISSPNCWGLFGGRAEPGETLAEAAAREVSEELTLPVEAGDLSLFGAFDIHPGCAFYSFTYAAGALVDRAILTEGQAFGRFAPAELSSAVAWGWLDGHRLTTSARIILSAYFAAQRRALHEEQ